MKRLHLFCLIAVLTLVSACGQDRPPLVRLTGKVTLDGKPLEGAHVALQPILSDPKDEFQRPSSGITDADGKFVSQTYRENDGVRLGKYRVAIIKRELIGTLPSGMSPDQLNQLNMKHRWITPRSASMPEASGIEIEATASGFRPEIIDLKSVHPLEIE